MLVVGGKEILVDGLLSDNFLRNRDLRLSKDDYRARTTNWIRGIVIHTRMGIANQKMMGSTDAGWDQVIAKRWARDDRTASAHIAIDADGSFTCLADLRDHVTYHAGQVNEVTIGIEIYQSGDGLVCEPSFDACVKICDVITRELGIQRQYAGESVICRRFANGVHHGGKSRLAYLPNGRKGHDFIGLYGHRNCTRNRGPGDPGDIVWEYFARAGYQRYDADCDEDLDDWVRRQAGLGMRDFDRDGVPGPLTLRYLKKAGYPHGMWVRRPGD